MHAVSRGEDERLPNLHLEAFCFHRFPRALCQLQFNCSADKIHCLETKITQLEIVKRTILRLTVCAAVEEYSKFLNPN